MVGTYTEDGHIVIFLRVFDFEGEADQPEVLLLRVLSYLRHGLLFDAWHRLGG